MLLLIGRYGLEIARSVALAAPPRSATKLSGRFCRQRVRFEPERTGAYVRIDAGTPPPCCFIAAAMDLAVVSSAQWDSKLVTHLAPERPALRKSQMVGI